MIKFFNEIKIFIIFYFIKYKIYVKYEKNAKV